MTTDQPEDKAQPDLLDFEAQALYFEDPVSEEVSELIASAAEGYGGDTAEALLLRAYFLEPDHLTVLVALYRYFYYQHRYRDAFLVAERAMAVAAGRLELRKAWQDLSTEDLAAAIANSMTLTRFYLMALKGSGYLKLRMDEPEAGLKRLEKVSELDGDDRLGVRVLVELARKELRRREIDKYDNVTSII